MEYSSLCDLITCLEYGTKLHIGVLFLGNYGNGKCALPMERTVHTGKVCDVFKEFDGGLKRCFRCRTAAIGKAIRTRKTFGGICINGVYEYTRPVVIDDEVACIIYIGNILDSVNGYKRLRQKLGDASKDFVFDTMEKAFSFSQCEVTGALIETYIRTLLDNVPERGSEDFSPLIENIKTYINTNLQYDINTKQIAEVFQYNEQYLGRLFKKKTGHSVCDYICKKRIDFAKRLLRETDETIINVSNLTGFNNVTYFNRVFKRCFNITPTQYREGCRAKSKG